MSESFPIEASARPARYALAKEVAQRHGLTVDDLQGLNHTKRYTRPRQEAMWLMFRHGYKKGQIGSTLRRTTWTVTHGIEAHERRQSQAEAQA